MIVNVIFLKIYERRENWKLGSKELQSLILWLGSKVLHRQMMECLFERKEQTGKKEE